MKTLVARLVKLVRKSRIGSGGRQDSIRRLVGEEEMLIAKGREQFQRLLEKGLSIPIATV